MSLLIHSPFIIYILAVLAVACLLSLVWGAEQRKKYRYVIRCARHLDGRYDKYCSAALDYAVETGEDEGGDALDGNLKILLRR